MRPLTGLRRQIKEVVCADEDPEVAYREAKKKYPDKEIVLWKVIPDEIYIF